jgi:ABC-type ATPase involved in cell division
MFLLLSADQRCDFGAVLRVMPTIELIAYGLPSLGRGSGLSDITLTLKRGEIGAVDADDPENARLLIRGLATLTPPVSGTYRFDGKDLDFSDYRRLLPFRRRVGYVAADAAMLSNRTLRQNLLTMRHYFENALDIDIDPDTEALCRLLGIEKELEKLPFQVDPIHLHMAIAVREISKAPDLMLFDRPEETIGIEGFRRLLDQLENDPQKSRTWFCATRDPRFLKTQCHRRFRIEGGRLTEDCGPNPGAPLSGERPG